MDVAVFFDLVGRYGLPLVMLAILARWTAGRIKKSDEDAQKRDAEAKDRENRMAARIDHLESKIEDDLTELVRHQGTVLVENQKVMEKCTVAIEECTGYFRGLRKGEFT